MHPQPSANWLALKEQLGTTEKKRRLRSSSIQESFDKRPAKKSRLVERTCSERNHHSPSPSSCSLGSASIEPSGPGSHSTPIIHPSSHPQPGQLKDVLQQMVLGNLTYSHDHTQPGRYLALDCEMVGVGIDGSESSLARVSLVNFHGAVVLDEFVKQRERVVDYRTQWSGVRAKDLIGAKPFSEIQTRVSNLIQNKILIGHAVHNDLKVLLLSHPRSMTRDTQVCAHRFGRCKTNRVALRVLVKQELGLVIQGGEHSSVTDARATMAVYRLHQKEWEKEFRPPKPSPRPSPPQSLTRPPIPSSSKSPNPTRPEPKPKKLGNTPHTSKRPKPGEKVVHGKKKSSNALSSSGGGSRNGRGKEKQKEKNEWWKQLPGSGAGVVGAAGSKGSFTKQKR